MKTKGKFWYSEKQRKWDQNRPSFGATPYQWQPAFALLDDGRIVEYTEMKSGDFIDNPSNYDDAVYLGEGVFHHVGYE